jgi:hypothetical protein
MDGMVERTWSSGDFQHVRYSQGIWEIRVDSWSDFGELLFGTSSIVVNPNDYLWRGQGRAVWSLKSRLDRMTPRVSVGSRDRQLKEFMHAMRGNGISKPPFPTESLADIDRWWSIGQHYGLATPFIDWTASPFIAAFFALANKGDAPKRNEANVDRRNADDRAVFALRRSFLDREKAEIRTIEVYSDDNPRLIAQAGSFTQTNKTGESVEHLIRRTSVHGPGMQLLKIIMPGEVRRVGLWALSQMNINHNTLFPDTMGAAQYCNARLDMRADR